MAVRRRHIWGVRLSFRVVRDLLAIGAVWQWVAWTGCSAPHDNPFDPASPGYIAPSPPARVNDLRMDSLSATQCRLIFSAPRGAAFYILESGPANWDGQSDSGVVRYLGDLPGVKPAGSLTTAWITLTPAETRIWALSSRSAEGLTSPRSNLVSIAAPIRDRRATLSLDAHSTHIAWWGLPDQYSLDVRAVLSDSDGVDSAWIQQDLNRLATLVSQGDGRIWLKDIRDYELPEGTVESLVGLPLELYHLDRAGFVTRDTVFTLARVIRDVPQTSAPFGDTLVSRRQPLVLRWFPYEARFTFTYSLEIIHMTEAFVPTRIYADSTLPADSTSRHITAALTREPGFFLWTVTVVDRFGNRARSREASFRLTDD